MLGIFKRRRRVAKAMVGVSYFLDLPYDSHHPYLMAIQPREGAWRQRTSDGEQDPQRVVVINAVQRCPCAQLPLLPPLSALRP